MEVGGGLGEYDSRGGCEWWRKKVGKGWLVKKVNEGGGVSEGERDRG